MKSILIALTMSLSLSAFAGTSAQDPNVKAIREAFRKADPTITNYYGRVMRLTCTRFDAGTNNYDVKEELHIELTRSGLVFQRTDLPKNFKPEKGSLHPKTFVQGEEGLTAIVTPWDVKNPAYKAYYVFRIAPFEEDMYSSLVFGEMSIDRNDRQSIGGSYPDHSISFPDKNVMAYYHCSASAGGNVVKVSPLVP